MHHAHKLVLGHRQNLIVQAAQDALLHRERMVVLDEVRQNARLRQGFLAVDLREESAMVAELLRNQQLDGGDGGGKYLHGTRVLSALRIGDFRFAIFDLGFQSQIANCKSKMYLLDDRQSSHGFGKFE